MQYEVIASFIICYIASPDTITVISMLALMPVVCPTAGPGVYQLWELAICWVLEGNLWLWSEQGRIPRVGHGHCPPIIR